MLYRKFMRVHTTFIIINFYFLGSFMSYAQIGHNECLTVTRLNNKVLLIRFGIQAYDTIAAIATEKGIVIIDTGISPTLTEKYKNIIKRELGRDDFLYVISTHGHYDHVAGNQVFQGTEIIAHHNCKEEMLKTMEQIDGRNKQYNNLSHFYDKKVQSEELFSIQRRQYICLKNMYSNAYSDLEKKYKLIMPSITFNDELTLDLDDVTLNLMYFGSGHSKSDIVISVPEEKILFAGSVILERGLLGHNEIRKESLERGNFVLDRLLKKNNEIEYVVTNHGVIFSKRDLVTFQNKIIKLLTDVNNGKKLFTAFMFNELITKLGIEKAILEYKKMRKENNKTYYFLEKEFIRLSFGFLSGEKLKEVIEISKLTIDAFPFSWLSYNVIAEAYLKKGDRKRAISYYEKSFKLNPENEFIKSILKELN